MQYHDMRKSFIKTDIHNIIIQFMINLDGSHTIIMKKSMQALIITVL